MHANIVVVVGCVAGRFVADFVARDGLLSAIARLFYAPSTSNPRVLLLCLRALGNIVSLSLSSPSFSASASLSYQHPQQQQQQQQQLEAQQHQKAFDAVARSQKIWQRLHQLLTRQLQLAQSTCAGALSGVGEQGGGGE